MSVNFNAQGGLINNRVEQAYEELSKLVKNRDYNLGELVLSNGKLAKINNHASSWFSNNRITDKTENEAVRNAVNAVLMAKGKDLTGQSANLLKAISQQLVGSEFKELPLTRREVCAYLNMLEGAVDTSIGKEDREGTILEEKNSQMKKLSEDFSRVENDLKQANKALENLVKEQKELLGIDGPDNTVDEAQKKRLNDAKTAVTNFVENKGYTDEQMATIVKCVKALKDYREQLKDDPKDQKMTPEMLRKRKEYRQQEIKLFKCVNKDGNVGSTDGLKDILHYEGMLAGLKKMKKGIENRQVELNDLKSAKVLDGEAAARLVKAAAQAIRTKKPNQEEEAKMEEEANRNPLATLSKCLGEVKNARKDDNQDVAFVKGQLENILGNKEYIDLPKVLSLVDSLGNDLDTNEFKTNIRRQTGDDDKKVCQNILEKAIQFLRKRNEELEKLINDFQGLIEEAYENPLDDADIPFVKVVDEFNELKQKVSEAQQAINRKEKLKKDIATLEGKQTELLGQINDLSNTVEQQFIGKWLREIHAVEHGAFGKSREYLGAHLKKLNLNHDDFRLSKKSIEGYGISQNALRGENGDLANLCIKKGLHDLKGLVQSVKDAREVFSRCKSQYDVALSALDQFDNKDDDVKTLNALKANLAAAKKERGSPRWEKGQISDLENQISDLEKRIEDLTAKRAQERLKLEQDVENTKQDLGSAEKSLKSAKEEVSKRVFSAFLERAHYNSVSKTNADRRLLLIDGIGKYKTTAWILLSKHRNTHGLGLVATDSARSMVLAKLEKNQLLADKFNLLVQYVGTSEDDCKSRIEKEVANRIDTSVKALTYDFDVLLERFVESNLNERDFDALLQELTEKANDFTRQVYALRDDDVMKDIMGKLAHDITNKNKEPEQEDQERPDRLKVLGDELQVLTSLGVKDGLVNDVKREYDELNKLYGTEMSDILKKIMQDFQQKREGETYCLRLAEKLKPMLTEMRLNLDTDKGDIVIAIKRMLADIKEEDVRQTIDLWKHDGFESLLLRMGIDLDLLLKYADVGLLVQGNRFDVLKDAMQNMVERIRAISGKQIPPGHSDPTQRGDLIEAGKLLATLRGMKERLDKVNEYLDKEKVKGVDREASANQFALSKGLEKAVGILTKGGVNARNFQEVQTKETESQNADEDEDEALREEESQGRKQVKSEASERNKGIKMMWAAQVNDLLVNQFRELRKYAAQLDVAKVVDLDKLTSDYSEALNSFNSQQSEKIGEIKEDWNHKEDWEAYTKDLTSFSIQQVSTGLTGGVSGFNPDVQLNVYEYKFQLP